MTNLEFTAFANSVPDDFIESVDAQLAQTIGLVDVLWRRFESVSDWRSPEDCDDFTALTSTIADQLRDTKSACVIQIKKNLEAHSKAPE